MEHGQEVNSPKRRIITINAFFREVEDRHEFGGLMSIDGQPIGPVTGEFPAELLATSRRRKGRPKNEPLKVAIALHEYMALSDIHKTGESKRHARVRAARALSIGGDEDNAEKYIRTHAKHDTALAVMSDYNTLLTWGGDAEGDGRAARLFRRDANIRIVSGTLHVSGKAWGCHWGEREAFCDFLELVIRTDAPHLVESIPEWIKGGINCL